MVGIVFLAVVFIDGLLVLLDDGKGEGGGCFGFGLRECCGVGIGVSGGFGVGGVWCSGVRVEFEDAGEVGFGCGLPVLIAKCGLVVGEDGDAVGELGAWDAFGGCEGEWVHGGDLAGTVEVGFDECGLGEMRPAVEEGFEFMKVFVCFDEAGDDEGDAADFA